MLALLQNCSMPLARAVRSPPRTHVRPCFTAVAYASISSRANSQSQVLLGLSDKELQQLALDLGQVVFSSFPIQFDPKRDIIQISRFFLLRQHIGANNFIIFYTRGSSEKFRISLNVGLFFVTIFFLYLFFIPFSFFLFLVD